MEGVDGLMPDLTQACMDGDCHICVKYLLDMVTPCALCAVASVHHPERCVWLLIGSLAVCVVGKVPLVAEGMHVDVLSNPPVYIDTHNLKRATTHTHMRLSISGESGEFLVTICHWLSLQNRLASYMDSHM